MTIPPPVLTVAQLKKVKNSVIGNPSNKRQMASDTKFIHQLVECIASQQPDNLRVEAAHVLASLSYGSHEALVSLVQADAHRVLVYTLSRLHNQPSLQGALARVLRALAVAVADVVGPSRGGLPPQNPPSRHLAVEALEFLFHIESLDVYLPLLSPSFNTPPTSLATAASICHLLGAAVRDPTQRRVITDWAPPLLRHAMPVHRVHRGWERDDGERARSWVIRALLDIVMNHGTDLKAQEAGLLALAALAQDSPNVSIPLTKHSTEVPSPLPTILSLAKTSSPDIQLASCTCITNIIRALPAPALHSSHSHLPTSPPSASPSSHHSLHSHSLLSTSPAQAIPDGETCARTVMSVLNTFFDRADGDRYEAGQGEAMDVRILDGRRRKIRACWILYHLVNDDAVLCEAAYERSCLPSLVKIVQDITPVPAGTSATSTSPAAGGGGGDGEEKGGIDEETVQEEPASISALREAALTTIASIALFDNDVRRYLTLTPPSSFLHSAVFISMEHQSPGVRYAACQYVRAVGRAVAVLRTSMMDSGLGMGVWRCLGREWEKEVGAVGKEATTVGLDVSVLVDAEKREVKAGRMQVDVSDFGEEHGIREGRAGGEHEDEVEGGEKVGRAGGDRRVMNAALMAVCNLVNDFSPMRMTLLDDGLVPRMASIIEVDEPSLRLNALWSLKNVLYKTTTDQKRRVMAGLGWAKLISLLGDSDLTIQEQAFNIVRNLVEDEEGIELVFSEIGPDLLLDTLVGGLNSSYEDVVLQAAYVFGNLANGTTTHHAHLLTHPRLLPALLSCLTHATKTEIRRPIVSCIAQLAQHSRHQSSSLARNAMKRAGFEDALMHICEWGSSASGPAPVSSSPSQPIMLPGIRGGLSVSLAASALSAGGRGVGPSMEGDRDVVNQARVALHWLDYVD